MHSISQINSSVVNPESRQQSQDDARTEIYEVHAEPEW